MDEKELCAVFKALSDPNRLKIVKTIGKGEVCACRLLEVLDVTQPTLSHHTSILVNSGLVNGRKDGQWVRYSINKSVLKEIKKFSDSFDIL